MALAGYALAAVTGPALNLTVFTGSLQPVPVRAWPPGMLAPAAVVVVVAALIVTAENVLSARRALAAVWQQTGRNLLAHLTAAENVTLPMRLAGVRAAARRRRAEEILGMLGVAELRNVLVPQLSGGQQQLVAVAVALANEPKVVLADEPTGELDTETAAEVFAALQTANAQAGVTVLIVTHDPSVSGHVGRTIAIRDGRIAAEVLRQARTDEHGNTAQIAQEYAVLDRAGRMQLPSDYVDALQLRDRVRLALETDHVGVWPDRPVSAGRDAREADR
jgi:ABC-type lipoprotein export system ATPase subunit